MSWVNLLLDTFLNKVFKYKEFIIYIFFGILTTLINAIFYLICVKMLDLRAGVATAISFIFAVIFAYFTNKIFVFKSESHGFLENFKDCMRFFSGRIFTGVLNVVVMEFTVEILGMSESFIFVLCQICVVILNYVLSKYAFKMKPGKSNMSK